MPGGDEQHERVLEQVRHRHGLGSGPLEVTEGGNLAELDPSPDAFIPDYHPEEIQEIAMKVYRKAGGS
jgi:hypothetical protein